MDSYENSVSLASFKTPQDAVAYMREYNQRRSASKYKNPTENDILSKRWKATISKLNSYSFSESIHQNEAKLIFIVGLPRSGKSSLEKLLNNLNVFHGAGELSTMSQTFRQLNGPDGNTYEYPDYLSLLPDDVCLAMGHDYLKSIQKETGHSDKIIIDTLPPNFIYIPLIRRILPQARIIWCHREPHNHCLNIFMKPFESTYWNFTYSMDYLVETYNTYRAVYKFYKEKMPEAWIDVEYEALSKNPKKVLNHLFDELGIKISSGAIKKAIRDNQNYLNVIEAENAAMRNYTPYLPELKNIQF